MSEERNGRIKIDPEKFWKFAWPLIVAGGTAASMWGKSQAEQVAQAEKFNALVTRVDKVEDFKSETTDRMARVETTLKDMKTDLDILVGRRKGG